jgi:hypothetical protein
VLPLIAGFGLILYAVGVQVEFQNTRHQNKVDVAKHPSVEFGYIVPYAVGSALLVIGCCCTSVFYCGATKEPKGPFAQAQTV